MGNTDKLANRTPDQGGHDLAATEHVRRYYEKSAGVYDEHVSYMERFVLADGRQWVCERARGDVLEIAVGTGRNLPFYPPEVRLTGLDLTPAMLDLARARAAAIGREVDLRLGNAEALDFPDGRFDTVVATLALCAIPNPRAAVAEARRVLRPGGRLLLLEHVRSPVLPVRLLQYLFNPICVRWHADHLLREPLDHVRTEGFVVERMERSKLGIVERLMARKPEADRVAMV